MSEMLKEFIGKDCHIFLTGGIATGYATVSGLVEAVENGWLTVKRNAKITEMININHLMRIYAVPLNEKGKRKAFY